MNTYSLFQSPGELFIQCHVKPLEKKVFCDRLGSWTFPEAEIQRLWNSEYIAIDNGELHRRTRLVLNVTTLVALGIGALALIYGATWLASALAVASIVSSIWAMMTVAYSFGTDLISSTKQLAWLKAEHAILMEINTLNSQGPNLLPTYLQRALNECHEERARTRTEK